MRRNSLSICGVLLIGVLAGSFLYSSLGPGVRTVSAQAMDPVGSYGVMTNKWTPVLTNSQEVSVGVMNFDGTGNVTWTADVYNTKGNPHHQTITFQGTYAENPDGTGTITWIVSPTQTAESAVVVVDGGAGLQFISTSENSQEANAVTSGIGRRQ